MERTGVIYKLECTCSERCKGRPRYVGQTLHPDKRLKQHLRRSTRSLVGDWVHHHGAKHIESHVLEWDVPQDQLDAREIHWVSRLGTCIEEGQGGLNATPGGQQAGIKPRNGRDNNAPRRLTLEQVWAIRDEHQSTDTQAHIIASRHGVSVSTVNSVVRNKTWYDPDYTFQPRARGNSSHFKTATLTESDVADIRRGASDADVAELAAQYNVTAASIRRVIQNGTWRDENYKPPTRTRKVNSPLTHSIARAMRDMYAAGDCTYDMVATKFKATRTATADILTGRTFKESL